MTKIRVQSSPCVLEVTSGCLAENGTETGCAVCAGYARLVGGFFSDVATESTSGLRIEQSLDSGANWDFISASDGISANGSASYSIELFGNAVRVTIVNGATEASALRASFRLRPTQ